MEEGKLGHSQRRVGRVSRAALPMNTQNEGNSSYNHNLYGQYSFTSIGAPPLGGPGPLIDYPNGLDKINNFEGPVSNPTEPKPSGNGTMGPNSNAPNPSYDGPEPKPSGTQPAQTREHDLYMPIANVVRIMRRALPRHAKVSDEGKEMIQECVSEFISFITGEANDTCHTEHRKTITAEDLIGAMSRLGFDNYVEPLTVYLQKHREKEMPPTFPRRVPPQFGMFGSPSGSGGAYHDGPAQTNVGPSPSMGLGNGTDENELGGPSRSGVGFQPYVPKK